MQRFKYDWVDRVLTMLKVPDEIPIENKRVTGAIASAQGQVESQNFESRKNVLKYDDVMNRQREVIYGERREVLEGADLHGQVSGFIEDVIEGYVSGATQEFAEEWDLEALWVGLKQLYPVSIDYKVLEKEAGGRANLNRDDLIADLRKDALDAYDQREVALGEENMRSLERNVLLAVLDRKWREHLYEMDYLREGIYLRAYSQRDPLVEYQREGFDMFAAMMDGIKEEAVGFLFNAEVQFEEAPAEEIEIDASSLVAPPTVEPMARQLPSQPQPVEAPAMLVKGLAKPKAPVNLSYSAPSEDGEVEVKGKTVTNADDEYAGVGRNADCPCGSGKKFKKCHGAPGGPTGLTARVNG
jgi:preprotein translocase subunit SecA